MLYAFIFVVLFEEIYKREAFPTSQLIFGKENIIGNRMNYFAVFIMFKNIEMRIHLFEVYSN